VIAALAHPVVSLSVSPARVTLASGSVQTLRIANAGAAPVVLDAATAGYALDLRGRARVVQGRFARSWLVLRPHRLAIQPGSSALLTVVAGRPAGARPGEHDALVLLTSVPRGGGGVAVRMRVGVVVAVRVPGAIVRRVDVMGLRVRRPGVLELRLANRGDLTERVGVAVLLRQGGRLVGRLRAAPRELLARTAGLVDVRYPARLHGLVTAVVDVARAHRSFRLRL
jgi:hypothetical protein